jgi:alpha-tubulin suppressor-like RCC1 family protein
MKSSFSFCLSLIFSMIIFSNTYAQVQPNDMTSWGYLQGFVDQPVQTASVGMAHCLVLKADGNVVGWGMNQWGQAQTPAAVTNVKAIDAYDYHSIAVKNDGTVAVWGYNGYGESTIPAGLSNVQEVSAGKFHMMALKADGTVVAWGDNSYGQTTVPAGLANVIAIAAGSYHSLAVKSDGSVVAWGSNVLHQTNIPGGLTGVKAVSAGEYHSIALKTDGTVVGWGYNFHGEINIPAGLTNVKSIASGYDYGLALKNDGTVVGWGDNSFGQLNIPAGLNNIASISASEGYSLAVKNDGTLVGWGYKDNGQANITYPLTGITSIACGEDHTIVATGDGKVTAWGNNNEGQISVPYNLTMVTAVEADGFYSLALKADGTVVAWGDNDYGQASVPAGLKNVVALASGGTHSLALKSDGTVVGWGDPSAGKLNIPAGLNTVIAIGAGYNYSVALKANGTVVVWGNTDYMLFISPPTGLNNVKAIASKEDHIIALKNDGTVVTWGTIGATPAGLTNVKAVAAGSDHCMAIKTDGSVVMWGATYSNPFGATTLPPWGLANVKSMAACSDQSAALYDISYPLSFMSDVKGITCAGANNGSIIVQGTFGTAPYTYSWNTTPAQTTKIISNLAPGTYSCTITDALGNTVTSSTTLQDPTAVNATTSQTNVLCKGSSSGVASVVASGGTSPYTYKWTNSLGSTTASINTIGAGTYNCTVKDANTCSYIATVTITEPTTALTATFTTSNIKCRGGNNGTGTFVASGGTGTYSYNWGTTPAQNVASVNNLAPGSYTASVTDQNNCSVVKFFNITQPSTTVTASVSAQHSVSCHGGSDGSATVTASGGTGTLSYTWNSSPAQTTANASGLIAGTYTCTVSDANNCSVVKTVSLSEPAPLTDNATVTDITCHGGTNGSISLSVSGGTGSYTYLWENATSTSSRTTLGEGTYTVDIKDGNLCTLHESFTVTEPAPLQVTFVLGSSNSICLNAAPINLAGGTPSGGIYSGSHVASNTFTPDATGSFILTYTYTDVNNCSVSATGNLEVTVCTSIMTQNMSSELFMVYPNPTTGIVYVRLKEYVNKTICLYNSQGEKIKKFAINEFETECSFPDLPQGLYFIKPEGQTNIQAIPIVLNY